VSKLLRYALIVIVAAWVINDPHSAALAVHKLLHLLTQAGHSLSQLASGL
jgi:hypothetical protein